MDTPDTLPWAEARLARRTRWWAHEDTLLALLDAKRTEQRIQQALCETLDRRACETLDRRARMALAALKLAFASIGLHLRAHAPPGFAPGEWASTVARYQQPRLTVETATAGARPGWLVWRQPHRSPRGVWQPASDREANTARLRGLAVKQA